MAKFHRRWPQDKTKMVKCPERPYLEINSNSFKVNLHFCLETAH